MSVSSAAGWEDRLRQTGAMLLNGWGFNWYREENLLRADDMMLRNRADALLGDALSAFRRAETVFRQKHLAIVTRGKEPDSARLTELRGFQDMVSDLEACRTTLRGAAMPPPDRIVWRNMAESGLLKRLGVCDAALAALAHGLRGAAVAVTPGDLASLPELAARHLAYMRDVLRERAALLDEMLDGAR